MITKKILLSCLLTTILWSCASSYKQKPSARKPYTPQQTSPVKLPVAPEPKPQGPTQTSPNYLIHIVQKGETLTSISKRYRTSLASIVRVNKLKTTQIKINQKLYISSSFNPYKKKTNKIGLPNTIKIVPRKDWCKYPMKSNMNVMGHINKITVHHTTAPSNLHKMSDLTYLNIIEKSHQKRGYACIGYHYLIGRDGSIYQGRPINYQGAHVSGANSNNIGVSVIGDFSHQLPNSKQLRSLQSILGYLRKKYQLPATKVYGHKHLGKSACPGEQLEKWVLKYRKL